MFRPELSLLCTQVCVHYRSAPTWKRDRRDIGRDRSISRDRRDTPRVIDEQGKALLFTNVMDQASGRH